MRNHISFLMLINIIIIFSIKKIKLTPVLQLGLTNEKIVFSANKTTYKFNTNLKHIHIEITQLKNINSVQITDNIHTTSAKRDRILHKTSNISNNTKINFKSKYCTKKFYITLTPDNPDLESSIVLTTKYILTEGEDNCIYRSENNFGYCGESSLNDCRNCKRTKCKVIECGYEKELANYEESFKGLFEICIPNDLSDVAKRKKCSIFSGANTYRQSIECNYESDERGYFPIVEIFGGVLCIVCCLAFVVAYYNIYVSFFINLLARQKRQPSF